MISYPSSPKQNRDVEQLEEAFAALLSAGIPYLEDATTLEEPSDEELAIDIDEEASQLSWMIWQI
jgi:RNA polymerase primary sigma factor